MSFIVVQESLGDLLPSRTWKMLIFFFNSFFFFPSFFPLKKEKAEQGVSLWGNKNELNLAIERVKLLQFPFTPPLVCFLLLIFPGGRVKSELLLLCCWCPQALLPAPWSPQLLKASKATATSGSCWQAACRWMPRTSYWGSPGWVWMAFIALFPSALHSDTVLPPHWPPSAGNSSECPPPGNAPDDTVCVDMGKCKDGECVPFCEREKNLRSCACNGGWRGTELKCIASALFLAECWPHCRVACWKEEFLVVEEV